MLKGLKIKILVKIMILLDSCLELKKEDYEFYNIHYKDLDKIKGILDRLYFCFDKRAKIPDQGQRQEFLQDINAEKKN